MTLRWRNPKIELPVQNQIVWVMLEPHKERGTLLQSAMSIEIVCGEASYNNDYSCLEVQNGDELGMGSIGWVLMGEEDYYGNGRAIAWLPVEEMVYPNFTNNNCAHNNNAMMCSECFKEVLESHRELLKPILAERDRRISGYYKNGVKLEPIGCPCQEECLCDT